MLLTGFEFDPVSTKTKTIGQMYEQTKEKKVCSQQKLIKWKN